MRELGSSNEGKELCDMLLVKLQTFVANLLHCRRAANEGSGGNGFSMSMSMSLLVCCED